MKENKLTKQNTFRWKQFNRKGYSVFSSLRKFNIGVLGVYTLGFANVDTLLKLYATPTQLKNYELDEIELSGASALPAEAKSATKVAVLSREEKKAAATHTVSSYSVINPLTGVIHTQLSPGYSSAHSSLLILNLQRIKLPKKLPGKRLFVLAFAAVRRINQPMCI